jgi:phosphate starvation-inducible membrane PsiE
VVRAGFDAEGTGESYVRSKTPAHHSTAASNLHRDIKDMADVVGQLSVDAFHLLALFVIGATTVWSAAVAFIGMVAQGHASLSDILLLFIILKLERWWAFISKRHASQFGI